MILTLKTSFANLPPFPGLKTPLWFSVRVFLNLLFLIGNAYAADVDILSNFGVDFLTFNHLEEYYDLHFFFSDYEKSRAFDPNIKKILCFEKVPWDSHLLPKEKLVFFLWEPKEYPMDSYDKFDRVYTWDDRLIDNKKFFRFNYPFLKPMREDRPRFEDKKFCILVNSNWTHERVSIIRFFEKYHPDDLEIYGKSEPPLKNRNLYKGSIPGLIVGGEKEETMKQYKFCICFENTTTFPGYITEKIFPCFAAGCIPIYWGAPNIEHYIPKSCFIDYRDFKSDNELYLYLKEMPENRYDEYLLAIQHFLSSEEGFLFTVEYFDRLLLESVTIQ